MSIKIGNTEYWEFDDLYNDPNITPPAERAKIEFEVALIGKLIEARERRGLSQRELADLAGLKQPAIARLESMKTTPQIDTLFKILQPLGYTLAIVPTNNPPEWKCIVPSDFYRNLIARKCMKAPQIGVCGA